MRYRVFYDFKRPYAKEQRMQRIAWFMGLLCLCLSSTAFAMKVQVEQVELRALLIELADAANMDVLISDKVQGKISYRSGSAKPQALLLALLKAQGLQRERVGKAWWIAPAEELKKQQARAQQWAAEAESALPTEVRLLRLKHVQAAEMVKLFSLGGAQERWLGPRGRADAEPRSNTLLLRDNLPRLQQLEAWLRALDATPGQVHVEARIVAVSRNQAKALGAQWSWQHAESSAQIPLALAGADVSALRYGILDDGLTQLDVQLSALLSEGEGDILARPSVVAQHLQKAVIASGQQIPYQETTHSGATTTRFVNAELSLEITPTIQSSDDIQLSLVVNHDSPGEIQPNGARAIDTNRLQTHVRLRNGQTLALGGIFRQQWVKATSRVPFLGKIPGLGWLFRRHTQRDDKQELFIFITPRLVQAEGAAELRHEHGAVAGTEHLSHRPHGGG